MLGPLFARPAVTGASELLLNDDVLPLNQNELAWASFGAPFL